jgi:hypothetical protein
MSKKGPKTSTELIEKLQRKRQRLERWFRPTTITRQELAWRAVGGNTFRAFHRMHEQPSVLFRAWALAFVSYEPFMKQLETCRTEREFDCLMQEMSAGLREYWARWTPHGEPMPFGPSRKLPNLLMKHLAKCGELPSNVRSKILPWLHIPWDSYSLRYIAPAVSPPLVIPASATMAYVKNEEMYAELRSAARYIGRKAGVPAIYLDVLAWNENH